MTLHKLTAGDGYEYLTRQVAAADTTDLGRTTLADYYAAKGEAPGRWIGSGLASLADTGARPVSPQAVNELWTVQPGSQVCAEQMRALFGEGRHPNAAKISAYVTARGVHGRAAQDAAKLGREFYTCAGETSFLRALAVAYREHNQAAGRDWNAAIDAPTRAALRTALAREKFADQYGRAPADDRELSGFIARHTRARTTAVAGYDLTFSPVKSVSGLWAIAPLRTAHAIEAAHKAAVADALEFLEQHAAFTRSGTNGVAQLDTTGLIGAAFTHRDSRAGDPDLHTHVAISNKVAVTMQGGVRWLALDGQPLHRVVVAASELYNTRLEAHLGDALGLRFADVPASERGKRPVREIVGMSEELMQRWSSRRAAIETRTAELSKEFHATHGREPTVVEMIALAQQATLESREAKHEPRSLAEQRHTWRNQAIEVLGDARSLASMLGAVLSTPRLRPARVSAEWVAARAGEVIDTVSSARATWQSHHVLAEAQRLVRTSGHAADPSLAQHITDAALSPQFSLTHARVADTEMGEPTILRRRDGASVYTRHGTHTYTSTAIVAAERRILAAAHRHGGRAASNADVELALHDSSARGKALNPGQIALVTEMATSGRRLELALAPAGSGKTTAMAALSHAWRASGGHVLGLAPTAAAAIELGNDLSAPTDTLAKLIHAIGADASPRARPRWLQHIGADTLIIIDEAGKAGTLELDHAICYALARGASVRLVGDDCQLASISAGGVLRDIAADTDALTLSQLVRFTSQAEAAATLALRGGDPAALAYYIDHHRVHVGSDHTAADMAYTAWHADLHAGQDSILLAPTNPVVSQLNARARRDRIASEAGQPVGRETILADGLAASKGDRICTRKNRRSLRIGRTDFVRNGYRYTILEVRKNGGLKVRHDKSGHVLILPSDYVDQYVTLGYASTIDSAQGLTAGYSCHIVGAGSLNRQLLYVALTRGRTQNHIYLSTAESDPHRILSPKATHPDTAVDVLSQALARDGAQISATSAAHTATDPFTRLGPAADMYYDAVGAAAEHYAGTPLMAAIDEHAETVHGGLTHTPAWPVLRKHLAILAAEGANPLTALTTAAAGRDLDTALDPAAVLDWRLDTSGNHSLSSGPLDWLPAIPRAVRTDPRFGSYLSRRAQLTTDLATQIRGTALAWTPATVPAWARPLIAADPQLAADIAVFRAAHHIEPADTRTLGPPQYATRSRTAQQALQQRAQRALTAQRPDTERWKQLVDSLDPRISTDSYWPQLATRLAAAAPARTDLAALLTRATNAHPLPDELPAAALWWRLSPELAPTATLDTTHAGLRPPWIPELHAVFGSATAQVITSDPAWPALVAAMAAANPHRWTPRDLLHVASEHLADADPDHTISVYDYARLITYTVDLFCRADHTPQPPVPEHPPLHPDDEEQLPPDPHNPHNSSPPADLHPNPFHADPPAHTEHENHPADPHQLAFDDLAHTRAAPPPLKPALADLYALRDRYTAARAELHSLHQQVRIGDGPAMRAAIPEIRDLRARADADRPYLSAVHDVIAEWAAEDEHYQNAINQLTWARGQLTQLAADPDTDPFDLASARLDAQLATMAIPDTSPAETHHPRLIAATAARADAAGGADRIVSSADVDTRIAAAGDADWRALRLAQHHLAQLRRHLERGEAQVAAAYAAAETRTAEHIQAQRDKLATELRILHAAGTIDPEHALAIRPAALTNLAPNSASAVTRLSELPFTVTALHAPPSKERTRALHTLHAAHAAAGRNVLWCTSTEDQARSALDDGLADTASTITDAHTNLISGHWQMPAHTLLVVDNAATADPHILADLAEITARAHARLTLLDTTTSEPWPPQPSHRLIQLLGSELPWSATLGPAKPSSPSWTHLSLDLAAALTQARRLSSAVLDDELRQALAQADELRTKHRTAYQRHLTITWTRHNQTGGTERSREAGLDAHEV